MLEVVEPRITFFAVRSVSDVDLVLLCFMAKDSFVADVERVGRNTSEVVAFRQGRSLQLRQLRATFELASEFIHTGG